MNIKSYKLFIVLTFLLCFLVFLYLRRKRLQENFECVNMGSQQRLKKKFKKNRFPEFEFCKLTGHFQFCSNLFVCFW